MFVVDKMIFRMLEFHSQYICNWDGFNQNNILECMGKYEEIHKYSLLQKY